MWSVDVNFDRRLWTKRSSDDVLGFGKKDVSWFETASTLQFPVEAVVESQLLDAIFADSIDSTVANMAGDSAVRRQHECNACCPHAFEVFVLRTAFMNRSVGIFDRFEQCILRDVSSALEKCQRDRVDSDLTREFSDCVTAHSVGDDEEVTVLVPGFVVSTQLYGSRILIVLSAHADIADRCVLDFLFPAHRGFPSKLAAT